MVEVLIDTSVWVAFFRGHEPLASQVDAALADGSAAACGMIELEVLQNVRPGEDDVRGPVRSTLRLRVLVGLEQDAGVRKRPGKSLADADELSQLLSLFVAEVYVILHAAA